MRQTLPALLLLCLVTVCLVFSCDAIGHTNNRARLRRAEKRYDHLTADECGKLTGDDKSEYDSLLKTFTASKIPAKKCPVKDKNFCTDKPLFIVTYGPSSSGKGYLLEKFMPTLYGVGSKEDAAKCFLPALVDDMIEATPRFQKDPSKYFDLRKVGACLNDRLVEAAVAKKVDVVFETIGKSAISEKWMNSDYVSKLSKDYCLVVLYPYVNPQKIKERVDERNKKGKRQVEWKTIRDTQIAGAQKVFLEYCKLIKATGVLFDNNGATPTPVFQIGSDGAAKCVDEKFICNKLKQDPKKAEADYAAAITSELAMFKELAAACKANCHLD